MMRSIDKQTLVCVQSLVTGCKSTAFFLCERKLIGKQVSEKKFFTVCFCQDFFFFGYEWYRTSWNRTVQTKGNLFAYLSKKSRADDFKHPRCSNDVTRSLWMKALCLEEKPGIYWALTLFPEKAMATHSSTLAWKIPWMEEPGRLQPMGSWRVGHNWATSLSLFSSMHWRRKWQPTPVFLPEESQGWGSLVGCCLWGHTESDTTEAT